MHISFNILLEVLTMLIRCHQRSSRKSVCYDQLFSRYIDNVKIESQHPKSETLYSNRQFLQMFCTKQRNQWFVVRFNIEFLTHQKSEKRSHFQVKASVSFSICAYRSSIEDSNLEI